MIRSAAATDYESYLTLFRELGVDDPTPTAARWTAELAPRTLVSERDGAVNGYVSFTKLSDVGYVRNLVTASAARRTGVGAELMRAAASELRAAGLAEWQLNVKVSNVAALRLYERLGLAVQHRSTALRLAWDQLDRLARDPAAVTALPVAASEDDDVERALGLLAGRIAMARHRGGEHVLVQLRDAGCAPVGFASFDPVYPGAVPFRVARPALAVALLEALRPYARPGDAALQLVIDDDPELVAILIAAGAEVRMQLLNLRGPLPT